MPLIHDRSRIDTLISHGTLGPQIIHVGGRGEHRAEQVTGLPALDTPDRQATAVAALHRANGNPVVVTLGARGLVHGTADPILPDRCARDLYARAAGPKELGLYAGDGHGLEHHQIEVLNRLVVWTRGVLQAAG